MSIKNIYEYINKLYYLLTLMSEDWIFSSFCTYLVNGQWKYMFNFYTLKTNLLKKLRQFAVTEYHKVSFTIAI